MRSMIRLSVAATLLSASAAFAQMPPDHPGPPDQDQHAGENRGENRGEHRGGPPSPAMVLERVHDELKISDDAWDTLSKKLKTIIQLKHEVNAGPGGGPPHGDHGPNADALGGPNRGGGPNGGGPGGGPGGGGPQDMNGGPGGGGPGGGGGGPGGPPDADQNPAEANPSVQKVREAKHALSDAIHDESSTPQQVKDAAQKFRDARQTAAAELTQLQTEVKSMTDERQQATLLLMNLID